MLQNWKNAASDNDGLPPDSTSGRVIRTLHKAVGVFKDENPIDETLEELCDLLCEGWSFPGEVVVRISYKETEYTSPNFKETTWGQTERFSTIDGGRGAIDVFYLDEKPMKDEGPFTHDERVLINQVARLLSGYLNRIVAARQQSESHERLKELSVLNQTTRIINQGQSVSDVLQQIAFVMPSGWQYPDFTVARIRYGGKDYTSEHFLETEWVQTQRFKTIDGASGSVDVYYTRDFSYLSGDPFLKEERDLLANLAHLITEFLNRDLAHREKADRLERVKELKAINETTRIINKHMAPSYTLNRICEIIPEGMQHPEYCVVRIVFKDQEFTSPGFIVTPWVLKQRFKTIDGEAGSIEIYYLKEVQKTREELFLNEEHDLIVNLSGLVAGYLNSIRARDLIEKVRPHYAGELIGKRKPGSPIKELKSKHLLQNFMHKNNAVRDIYHDLMPFSVKEILLVANLYDAYAIEREGRFAEQMVGGYHQLHLTSLSRVTGVTTYEEAFEQLNEKHFDLIIVMVGVDKQLPVELSRQVKKDFPYIPIFLLLSNDLDIPFFEMRKKEMGVLDELFVWNGDSRIFSAMISHLEDKVNVENDTQIGLARVILLVEDSVKYYSKYLPLLYSSVLEQTNRIIEDVSGDELYAVLRLRARPKVLLVRSYEEALDVFNRYKDYLLCLISDVQFYRNGQLDANAGFDLVNFVKEKIKDLPVIIQSSKIEYSQDAYELKTVFVNKNSESLLQDIKTFISHYLGFGNFVYKDANGKTLAVARNLKEFEHNLCTVPVESIVHHARKNHFSLWLMARGEIKVAKMIAPYRISDFETSEHLREYLCDVIRKHREEQNQGKVMDFDEVNSVDEGSVVSLSGGSLGGKGRGLAFINTLLYNFDFESHVGGINIKIPRTTIIGTDEFELFLERNNIKDLYFLNLSSHEVKKIFLKGDLSLTLTKRLKRLLSVFTKPLAVRSSGMLEDSLKQPFAGVYETYLLPNVHPDREVRLNQLSDAIKLVFASVFSETARAYTEAVDFKVEEEKMAVVIQEVVGSAHEQGFYPHISGVAQSYNYYSFGHMNPDDGFAIIAFGLGKYVVDGEKAHRFCPVYPELDNNSPKDQVKNTQTEFYGVDLGKQELNLLEGEAAGLARIEIYEAEAHRTLKHCASVYDPENNTITPGLDQVGPRVVNFANILKYNYIPLGKTIEVVLDVVKEAIGAPVEIEFAVDLNKDRKGRASFYLLQIKPLIGSAHEYRFAMDQINKDEILLYTNHGMGNGKIDTVTDVVYLDVKTFDKSKTREMAEEIELLNTQLKSQDRKYVLIGPGRWGTRDPWIGIPVNWPQISNAQVIVETSLEDYPLEASGGSHFFHNVTSMQVGYFSIQHHEKEAYIQWPVLEEQKLIQESQFFKHVRFENPLVIRMDGRSRKAVITFKNGKNN
jgi:hypothetical protein